MPEVARIAPPPDVVTDPVVLAAQVAELNRAFPWAHVWTSDEGRVYAVVPACRARQWPGPRRTVYADNPAQMRVQLGEGTDR